MKIEAKKTFPIVGKTTDFMETPELTGIMRSTIINSLLQNFPKYYANEDISTKRKALAEHYQCGCTDCGGNDAVCECKVENAYFEFNKEENPYYESFGAPIENVIMNTHV